ncbi:MAG: alpha/beta fold hydrolase [Patescibacteria group bacterium]|jgi:pimeloyl-ACP methyl ester carboxylesterase
MSQFIHTRNGKKLAVVVDIPENPRGLAFVLHGWRGFKEQPHIEAIAESFVADDIVSVRLDTQNAGGESGGSVDDLTITGMQEDFEDTLAWAVTQLWFRTPFFVAGHSAGAHIVVRYAAQNPQAVCGVVSASAIVDNDIFLSQHTPEEILDWKEKGYRMVQSRTQNPTGAKMTWKFINSYNGVDLRKIAKDLTMPVLIIVGENDSITGPAVQQLWFEKIAGLRTMHVIPNGRHTLIDASDLTEIKETVTGWLHELL